TSFKQKWTAARYTDERFLKRNEEWLKASLELPSWSHNAGRPVKQFQELNETSKRRRTKVLRAQVPVEEDPVVIKYTPREALSLFVGTKKECYPDEQKITVTETGFNVDLQALLDHTALRLIQYFKEVTDTLTDFEKQHLLLISKWG
ncbi:hypothetical protein HW555_006467, partial [Spodoptera exigua]